MQDTQASESLPVGERKDQAASMVSLLGRVPESCTVCKASRPGPLSTTSAGTCVSFRTGKPASAGETGQGPEL